MTPLAPNEYDLLLDCIRELHTFHSQTALRSWLLDTALPKLVPSDWLSYNEVNLLEPEKTVSILKPDSNTFFEQLFPRFKEVAHQHPLIVRQIQFTDFPVHKISDFLTQDAYHQLDLYQDVYRPMGVEYQIAATIWLDPGHVTAFALSRQKQDYTERDRTILEMLRPHLVVAFNNLALLNAHRTVLDGTKLALNELASATLIIDPKDRILYHTGPGLQWIGATSPGVLPESISEALKVHSLAKKNEPLKVITAAGEICIRLVPTDSLERRLLVLTQSAPPSPLATPATADFGLSKRQQEVAQWIGAGKTNAEIATILGISPRTVQKHVEHILTIMSVESRVAIATRLLERPQ